MLSVHAVSDGAKRTALKLKPLCDRVMIEQLQQNTRDAYVRMEKHGLPSFAGVHDIRASLKLLEIGSALTPIELLDIASLLEAAESARSYAESDKEPVNDSLTESFSELILLKDISSEIRRCILSADDIADDATPALKSIRRRKVELNARIHSTLDKIIKSDSKRSLLMDAIITIRNGRYCIPVKVENRNSFPGMIHDRSSTGSTLFIEPMEVVNLNNETSELEAEEKAEIEKLLAELSRMAGSAADDIAYDYDLMIKLDFIYAKAKFAKELGASEPVFNDNGIVELKRAVHPLLDRHTAVPVDIKLGETYSLLIVTGPNTGGKTVSLKTLGLLTLMGQSGLHIPAAEGSRLTVFNDVFADIGDEQSIEQNLSTFSSHMSNIIYIVEHSDDRSLCLFDEPGGGTDPAEGAALAISILDKLRKLGASVFATTHYTELKKYALSTEGVSNASMEFDVETLSPTYRLLIGVPGKSNAFEISKKLGLSPEIIRYAEGLIEGGDMEFEDVISSIADDRKNAEQDRLEAARLAEEARAVRENLERKEQKLEAKRQEILDKAREEARDIIREAKETSKELQKQINDLEKSGFTEGAQAKLEETRRKLKEAESKFSTHVVKQVNSAPVSASEIKVGDRVKHLTLDQNGEIVSLPDDKGDVMVLIGALKVSANVKDLMLINEGKDRKQPARKVQIKMQASKSQTISASVNVVGKNLEEALSIVEKYVDDVYLAGLEKATIIHGRGEGILKRGIRDMLKHNKLVKSYQAGAYNEGGEGVTVVTMKK